MRCPHTREAAYVVNRRTDYHACYYTDPPGDSLFRHDHYHTGFILDALRRFMQGSGDFEWQQVYDWRFEFNATKHFTSAGAPRWMSDQDFRFDLRGAAQGILGLSRRMGELRSLTERIANWAVTEMYAEEGRFFYRQTRRMRKRFTLMRRCNAWMASALASMDRAAADRVREPRRVDA